LILIFILGFMYRGLKMVLEEEPLKYIEEFL